MPDGLNIYKSTLTPQEVDEAFRNIGKVQANIEKAAGYAQTAEQYGTIVQQNQAAIQAIEDNLSDVQGAAQNAADAKNAATSAAASASAASQSASDAEDAAKRAEAAAGVDPNDYYPKAEADKRFQMPIGFYFDWAPVSGGPDLSTAQKVAAHFGYGTWKEISGVFMLSRSSSYTVGSSGGSETHQHPLSSKGYAYIGIAWNTSDTSYIESKDFGLSTRYSGSRMANLPVYRTASDLSRATELGGATDAADSMPPYLVCHRWQRIA